MIRRLALALSLSAAASTAGAAELDFERGAPGRAVVDSIFPDYLSNMTAARVGVAVVDIDRDGTGEVLARFEHSTACSPGGAECRTVLLRHERGTWRVVLDRMARSVTLEEGTNRTASLSVDGETWSWRDGSYFPPLDGMGTPIRFAPVPADFVPQLSVAFGQGAVALAATGMADFEYSTPRISDEGEFIVVRMAGEVACGHLYGCPVRILKREGDAWQSVVEASTTGGVTVASARRAGMRDVGLETRDGYVTLGWTGTAYAVADRKEGLAR